jgi:chromate transporter
METPRNTQKNKLAEVTLFFLRLGFTAFGGPAAYIAMMRQEVVERRNWISDERFLDLLSIINLIPGPNATELAIYLGYIRAGWLGLVVGGVCFIVPAMLMVLALAWAYATYGTFPEVSWLLYGIKPVVIAIIAQAVLGLSRTIMKGTTQIVLALLVLVLYLFGINVLILLFGGALLFAIVRGVERWLTPKSEVAGALFPFTFGSLHVMWHKFSALSLSIAAVSPAVPFSMLTLFLTFLKIGAVLYYYFGSFSEDGRFGSARSGGARGRDPGTARAASADARKAASFA